MAIYKLMQFFLLMGTIAGLPSSTNLLANESEYRLPKSIIPIRYNLEFMFLGLVFTDISNNFEGKVEIEFNLIDDAPELKFHASSEYIRLTLLVLNGIELNSEQYSLDVTTDIVTVPLTEHNLTNNETYFLYIEYNGIISTTDNYGIYKSSYTKSDGEVSYLLTTQFEPTYARRAFPCFDEPSFKAIFNVSITYYSDDSIGLGVLFNTPRASENFPDDYMITVNFEPTPKMSSYLVAFTISDFTSVNGTTSINGTDYAVWSREDLSSSRGYAAEVGPRILEALNVYMGRNYNTDFNKVDQVALPDFAAGAMENWGLVTYRERYLLWDSENTADTVKQSIATIIAHEFAHQWFGNLITCDWWSETFLNEGFATYFEFFTTHEIEPSWELDKQFVVSVLHSVLDTDSLEHAQALKSDASTPQEISNKFGLITYNKGGSILRMLAQFMGEENYKQAIQEYVQTERLQFDTVTSTDVWDIFQNHLDTQYSSFPSDASLANVMENWIEKPGYPLLTVSLNGKNLTITQERFLISGDDKESKWFVPISYAASASEVKFQNGLISDWLTPTMAELTITLEEENSWVILNTFQTGYYRVNYDSHIWNNLAVALQEDDFDGIVDLNRAQIVDDLFNIAKAKIISYPEVFHVIEYLKHETSYIPWVPAFNGFQYVLLRVPSNSITKTKIQEHLLSLMEELYKTVPISETKDDQMYTLTQSLASSWACLLGEETCVTESRKIFSDTIQNKILPHKNVRSVVYCNGLRYSQDTSEFDYLWDLYSQTQESNEQLIILRALGCSNNADKLEGLLGETLKSESAIRSQDAASVFAAVYSGSEEGVDIALDFLIQNFKAILEKYSSMSAQRTLIKGIASRLTTAEQINKLKEFIATNAEFEADLKEVSQEALEEAESNLDWYSTHQSDLQIYYGIDDGSSDEEGGGAYTITVNVLVLSFLSFMVLFA